MTSVGAGLHWESLLLLAAGMRNPGMVHTLDLPLCRLKLELWQKKKKKKERLEICVHVVMGTE